MADGRHMERRKIEFQPRFAKFRRNFARWRSSALVTVWSVTKLIYKERIFNVESKNVDIYCIMGSILAVHCSFFQGLFKAFNTPETVAFCRTCCCVYADRYRWQKSVGEYVVIYAKQNYLNEQKWDCACTRAVRLQVCIMSKWGSLYEPFNKCY